MLNNYLTTALRRLWRERGYAAINLFGLAIGFALCLLIGQFAAYQLSVGDFHDKKDRVFRVLQSDVQDTEYTGNVRIPLGPTLKEQLPEVEEAVRFSSSFPVPLRVGDQDGIYEEIRGVDAGVFDMFSLPLLRGDPKTALTRPYTMVLTEPLARRLFGDSDPIGQVVRVGDSSDYEVTGIVGQPPANSLLQFSALRSMSSATNPTLDHGWSASGFRTFVQLTPDAAAAAVAARIPGIVKEATGAPEESGSYALQPLKSIYFDMENPCSIGPSGNPVYLALCAILAVVILTIAIVNYANLATARAGRRTHEIGVRKALGAYRGQLIRQLLSESVLMSTVATVLGMVLAEVLMRLIPIITGADFELPALHWTLSACLGAAALAVGGGLVAGASPAWVVAHFQPETAVRRGRVGGARLRQGLVVAQFASTTALLAITLLIWHQVEYSQNRLRENSILGLEPEQVVVVRSHGLTPEQTQTFKKELLQDSRIAAVSLSLAIPGGGWAMSFAAGGEDRIEMTLYIADGDFVEIMGLHMVQGRALTDEPADAQAVVINETAARVMGLAEPLGKTIDASRGKSHIVGVIEDFHFQGLRSKIEPLVIVPLMGWSGFTIVRVRPGHLDEALKAIDDKWAALAPYRPIQRNSLQEVTASLYSEDLVIGRTLTAFLFLTIAIASVGLFGMAAHAAAERTREIGIRKVFGASPSGLTAMLLRDFAKPIAIAFVLSVPIAYGLADHWLQEFAYRVEIGVGLFLLSGALSFAIAGLTVGHQAMRAALTNPLETLRAE